jgi:Fe-S-cluster containining protein
MTYNNYESEEIFKLDLERYELAYLDGQNLLSIDNTDMDALLEALGKEDISLNVPLPCAPDIIFEILSSAECRRCGKCCQPNPLNPDSPGIEVFEEELEEIARFLNVPLDLIKEKTSPGKFVPHPFGWTKLNLSSTRWLPLPCPFFDAEQNECRVHRVRPVVCKIHPVIFVGDPSSFSIKLNCDYGKDLVKKAYEMVKQKDPDCEIIL